MVERLPKSIQEGIEKDNTEHLRAAGRKGALTTNEKKRTEAIKCDVLEAAGQIKAEEERLEAERAANEHIIDPDGVDQNYNPDNEERE